MSSSSQSHYFAGRTRDPAQKKMWLMTTDSAGRRQGRSGQEVTFNLPCVYCVLTSTHLSSQACRPLPPSERMRGTAALNFVFLLGVLGPQFVASFGFAARSAIKCHRSSLPAGQTGEKKSGIQFYPGTFESTIPSIRVSSRLLTLGIQ